MGLMLSSLLVCSGGAALLACVYPNWEADRAALTQAVHLVAFGLVAFAAGILAGQMNDMLFLRSFEFLLTFLSIFLSTFL